MELVSLQIQSLSIGRFDSVRNYSAVDPSELSRAEGLMSVGL